MITLNFDWLMRSVTFAEEQNEHSEEKVQEKNDSNLSGGKNNENDTPNLVLRLSSNNSNNQRVHWSEETVDNENLGKKKSNCKLFYAFTY